jgi:hypothetical protein
MYQVQRCCLVIFIIFVIFIVVFHIFLTLYQKSRSYPRLNNDLFCITLLLLSVLGILSPYEVNNLCISGTSWGAPSCFRWHSIHGKWIVGQMTSSCIVRHSSYFVSLFCFQNTIASRHLWIWFCVSQNWEVWLWRVDFFELARWKNWTMIIVKFTIGSNTIGSKDIYTIIIATQTSLMTWLLTCFLKYKTITNILLGNCP